MKRFLIPLLLLISLTAKAENNFSFGGKWKGLNNGDASILIDDNEAQDLQDVDISETGSAIVKRDGYTQFKTIGVSTIGVRGGYFFRDASGNDLTIHANNQSVYKSASGGNYSAFITTDTAGSYYDFTDSNGVLYRATSNRDQLVSYNGTASTFYPSLPLGNQVEALPDRLAISGTAANPNRVNFSGSASFTNFTTGVLESDPFTEDFGLPGQSIQAIKYACGRLLVWTNSTFSFWQGSNQYDGEIQPIVGTVGTLQPNSIVEDLGLIYWQGQDKHFYVYDCNVVTKISQKIKNSVVNFAGGEAKDYSETLKSDFDLGTQTGVTSAISVGDIELSTWTQTDTTTADFTAGTSSNTSVINNRVYLSTDNANVPNNSFESGTGTDADNWTESGSPTPTRVGAQAVICQTLSPDDGSWMMETSLGSSTNDDPIYTKILDSSGNLLETINNGIVDNYSGSSGCGSWGTVSNSLASYVGRYIKIKIEFGSGSQAFTTGVVHCSGGTMTYRVNYGVIGASIFGFVDKVVGGVSDIYSGTFTSQAFNTAFTSAAWQASGANWTTNSNAISFQTQVSSDASNWSTAVSWSTGSAPGSVDGTYIRYVATLSTGNSTSATALPYIDDVTFTAKSDSGTFISQIINPGVNITSWNNFSADQTLNSGTIAYFMRGNTTSASVSTTAWAAVTRNSQIGISTNPYVQVRANFAITSSAYNPIMSNFTISWNEGTIGRTFGTVDSSHRILWSLSDDGSATNTSTYIYDPRFDSWLKYSVPFDAVARVGTSLRFGDPSSGTVYTWPSGTSDAGSAITAFYKSKDFILSDPFSEKDMEKYNFILKSQTGSNIDFTYTVDASSFSATTNYSLTDPLTLNYRRINNLFPVGTFGTFINFKFGNDDADAPFELYIAGLKYTPREWRVME